ncbi:MAG: NUDIX hydrolase [Acidimicrobiales bacterium]|jgi:ADP-ribose pyrophosphatase
MTDGAPPAWEPIAERPGPSGYVQVTTVTYRFPDGRSADWDLVTGPDAVAVLALTPGDEVILARQYRPGPGKVLDELPGGLVDPGETPAEAAARELLEETGYEGAVEIVGWLPPAANMTRRNWVAVALDCERLAQQALGPYEYIEVVTRPLGEFRNALGSLPLTDLGAAYLALDRLGRL